MENQIKCPKCNQVNNHMIDHLPLEFKTIPFDDELYATFQCLQSDCLQTFQQKLQLTLPQPKRSVCGDSIYKA